MEKILKREKIIKLIRKFFDEQGFHEVIIPILHEAVPLEPNIYPFTTEWHANDKTKTFYLPTSPERHLKKMLAQGLGNCYAIGHSFRDLEAAGPLHTPEFLMLEWYRKDADYRKIMQDVEELFLFCNESSVPKFFHAPWECSPAEKIAGSASPKSQKKLVPALSIEKKNSWSKFSLNTLFKEHTGIYLENILEDAAMTEFAEKKQYSTQNSSWHELFDQIFVNEIENKLPHEPFFLVDFPLRISSLCAPQKDNPLFAQRFELYINGIEIGNGNTERTDAEAIQKVFETEQQKREIARLPHVPVDHEFLSALKAMEGSQYAGIGIGIDRFSDAI